MGRKGQNNHNINLNRKYNRNHNNNRSNAREAQGRIDNPDPTDESPEGTSAESATKDCPQEPTRDPEISSTESKSNQLMQETPEGSNGGFIGQWFKSVWRYIRNQIYNTRLLRSLRSFYQKMKATGRGLWNLPQWDKIYLGAFVVCVVFALIQVLDGVPVKTVLHGGWGFCRVVYGWAYGVYEWLPEWRYCDGYFARGVLV